LCYQLLERLKAERANAPLRFARRSKESPDQFAQRIGREIVPRVHDGVLKIFEKQERSLPPDIAYAVARQAVLSGRVSDRRLVYALLGYYVDRGREQMRGIIERAEADYPEYLRYPRSP
jgi:hypothetical protein